MEIKIMKIRIEVRPVVRKDNIKAFVIWVLETERGNWIIRGGTIRLKPFGKDKELTLSYDPPAFKSRGGYNKMLFIEDKDFYKRLCRASIRKYRQESGESEETYDINIDEIPV